MSIFIDKQMKKEAVLIDNKGKNCYHIDIDLVFIRNLVYVFRILKSGCLK